MTMPPKYMPFTAALCRRILRARAEAIFQRYGQPVLLFSWVPVIGDPLTLAAGLLRMPWLPFLVYVTIGKAARYAVLVWIFG